MKVGCPNCGGNIKFVPEKQLCVCDSCKSEIQINDIKYNECNYDNYKCSSCGGTLLADEITLITVCPYCNSHQLVKTKYDGVFKPNKIIPFKFGNKDFYSIFVKKVCAKRFAVKNIKDVDFNEIKGIYVPFKKVNVVGVSNNRGNAFNFFHSKDDKFFEYNFNFNANIVYDTSSNFENKYTNFIGPFNYDDAIDFNPSYLCNFSAQIGNEIDDKNIFTSELLKMTDEILTKRLQIILPGEKPSGYSYDFETKEKTTHHVFNGGVKNINFGIVSEDNILLPIWFVKYTYKSKQYFCMMNGQTGNIIGKTPISFIESSIYTLKNTYFIFLFIFLCLLFTFFSSCLFGGIFKIVYLILLISFVPILFIMTCYFFYKQVKEDDNIRDKNLIGNYEVENILYKQYASEAEYLNIYKDDNLNRQDITISNSKDMYFHNNTESQVDLDNKENKE